MPAYQCELCEKVFKQKGDLDRHKEKKTPCVSAEKIIEKHKNEIIESKNSADNINEVKKFLDFCHNTLRDKEGIIGMKALSNIAMLLFLKFVNTSVKEGTIDLLNIEKYRKENGTSEADGFKKNKNYIKYCQFENIIENGKLKCDETEIMIIIEFIFRHILWVHPKTKNIFQDEMPTIKNDSTYVNILKRMDKIPWDEMDIDIKGIAYEHFLKYEMGSGSELGQFFTKREVVDYMINIIKPYIKLNSTFIDPFMGTGGFVTHMFNEIRNMYKKNNKPFTDEIKNNLTNGIEKNPQTCLLALNNMLLNMDLFPENVKCGDSLRNFIDEKYDFVLTNPPFGIKGLEYGDGKNDNSSFPKEFNSIKKEEYFPYKSNDAICLALQMIPYILNNNGIAAVVVPDGKQITGEKEKSLVETRKNLIENNNLFQITKLPSGTFLPYTGVETMILFFKKGEKTKEVKFVKLDETYKKEILICNVKVEKIKAKNYSLNYKLYHDLNKIIYKNSKYIKFSDLFSLEKGDLSSKNTIEDKNGKAVLINWSLYGNYKKIIKGKYFGENVFISTNLPNGKEKGYLVVTYYNGECDCSNLMSRLVLNNDYKEIINIKFYYYYLKFNSEDIENTYQKGCANKSLDIQLFNEMQIPIPPIEVQNLIVKELDTMYKQKEDLISAIKLNDEFKKIYFDDLLKKYKNIKLLKLDDVCDINYGKRILKENSGTLYPVYGGGDITFYYDNYNRDGQTLIISRFGCSKNCVRIIDNKLFLNDSGFSVHAKNIISQKYLNYFCKNISEKIYDCASGSAQKNMDMQKFNNLEIQLPSLKEQEEIVKEMEKQDELISKYQEQIKLLDIMIKKRFDEHLQRCKDSKDNKDKPKEETDKEIESESEVENSPKKESKKIKVKSKKLKEVSDIESESEVENKLKKKVSKKKSNND